MASRPKTHRCEVSRAIVMIAKRRAKVEDRNRDRLPDSPDSDPREVLDYLQKYSTAGTPRWVLQADVCDALTLNNWLWWEDLRRELHFLRAGPRPGTVPHPDRRPGGCRQAGCGGSDRPAGCAAAVRPTRPEDHPGRPLLGTACANGARRRTPGCRPIATNCPTWSTRWSPRLIVTASPTRAGSVWTSSSSTPKR
jgi:hypothetical protein